MMKSALRWFFLFSIFFLVACSEKPEKFLQKAAKALQKEDSAKAAEYYQKAYLLSLDKKYFPLGRKQKFYNLESDSLGEHILLTAQTGSDWQFWLLNSENKKLHKKSYDGFIEQASISPSGEYLLFTSRKQKKDESCRLSFFAVVGKAEGEVPVEVSCSQLAAIDDDGWIVFSEKDILKKYNAKEKKFDNAFSVKLNYSISSITPKASLFFSPSHQLFATYGQAGMYNIYKIQNNSPIVISNNAAYSRLMFISAESLLVAIEGGAGKRELVFLREPIPQAVKRSVISGVSDFSFINSSHFYGIEKGKVKEYSASMVSSLPFFAQTIRSDKYQQVYILTPEGIFIKFYKELPPSQVMDIFSKIQELNN